MLRGGSCVVGHSIQNKCMYPVAGPLIAAAQRLENDEGLAQYAAMLKRAVEREIERKPTRGNHPIEDITT